MMLVPQEYFSPPGLRPMREGIKWSTFPIVESIPGHAFGKWTYLSDELFFSGTYTKIVESAETDSMAGWDKISSRSINPRDSRYTLQNGLPIHFKPMLPFRKGKYDESETCSRVSIRQCLGGWRDGLAGLGARRRAAGRAGAGYCSATPGKRSRRGRARRGAPGGSSRGGPARSGRAGAPLWWRIWARWRPGTEGARGSTALWTWQGSRPVESGSPASIWAGLSRGREERNRDGGMSVLRELPLLPESPGKAW